MILSIGYRVKSSKGIHFRRWANTVLKEYLLKGYALNNRFAAIEGQLREHQSILDKHDKQIDFFIRSSLPPVEGIFYNGQIFDAYVFVSELIKNAQRRIILIDDDIYHIGASLKDLGKKLFAFSKMNLDISNFLSI